MRGFVKGSANVFVASQNTEHLPFARPCTYAGRSRKWRYAYGWGRGMEEAGNIGCMFFPFEGTKIMPQTHTPFKKGRERNEWKRERALLKTCCGLKLIASKCATLRPLCGLCFLQVRTSGCGSPLSPCFLYNEALGSPPPAHMGGIPYSLAAPGAYMCSQIGYRSEKPFGQIIMYTYYLY